jgi:hypothetical protein
MIESSKGLMQEKVSKQDSEMKCDKPTYLDLICSLLKKLRKYKPTQ